MVGLKAAYFAIYPLYGSASSFCEIGTDTCVQPYPSADISL